MTTNDDPNAKTWHNDTGKPIYRTADDRLVDADDPEAAFLVVGADGTIARDIAEKYGLTGEKLKAAADKVKAKVDEAKAKKGAPENKSTTPEEDSARVTSYATIDQLRLYLPQVSDLGVQRVTVTGAPTGGTFTLSYEGVSAAALAYNATATAVQTALRALAAIGVTGCKVSGRPGGPYVVTFQGTLATDAGPLTLAANGLTGGTSPDVTIDSAMDDTLQLCLDNATDIVRKSMRALLADPTFDYSAYESAGDQIIRGHGGQYLTIGAHQIGSVSAVAFESSSVPVSYTALSADEWDEQSDGRLYRAVGWSSTGSTTRYQITAIWGYGPDASAALVQTTLELAVNIWRTRDRGGFTDTVGVSGQGQTVHVAGLTNLQKQVLIAERDTLISIGV